MLETSMLADDIYRARSSHTALSDASLATRIDYEAALATQLLVLRRLEADGHKLGGWKVGLTSGSARDSLGAGVRPFGFLLKDRVLSSPARVQLQKVFACQVEAELSFEIAEDIGGEDVTSDMVRPAVASVSSGFEINEIRATAPHNLEILVADGLSNWGVVFGEPSPVSEDLSSISVELKLGHETVFIGVPLGGIDDHFKSLAALCRSLARHGHSLKRGDRCITGSFTRIPLNSPGIVSAKFTGLAPVEVRFV